MYKNQGLFLKAHQQPLVTSALHAHTLHQAGADVAQWGDLYKQTIEGLHLSHANVPAML